MPVEGGLPEALPLPMACTGAMSPDGKRMIYAPLDGGQFAPGFTNFVSWKRYRGGEASYLWLVNFADLSTVKIPRADSNDINPMWIGDKTYFLSDRGSVQGAMGESPAIAGLALGASSILWTFGTFGAGRMMVRSSYRAPAQLGGIVMMIGAVLLLTASPSLGVVWVGTAAGVLGLGMGLSNTVFLIAVQTAVGWNERGAATSANSTDTADGRR